MTYIGLAGPLYERNELDNAMRCVKKALELSKQARNTTTIRDSYFGLARLHQALGNLEGAREAVREVEDLAHRGGDSYWLARACAFRSQWWLERGDIASASRCAQACRSHASEGAGLARELAEELGIDVGTAEPLMRHRFDYPDRVVRLDVWWVESWTGAVRACEGQQIKWVSASELVDAEMLPADAPLVAAVCGRLA